MAKSEAQPQRVAIIGMACRLPGNVSSLTGFWEMLVEGKCGWSEIPDDKFTKDAFYHPHPQKKGCFNATGGYFLRKDHSRFNAAFFNITEHEARAMDPQQRLLLECTFEALENAGIPKESVAGRNIGVFVGGAASDYHLGATRDLDNIPMFEATGYHQSIQSGRISHYLDLRGPCLTVDTACSSGLSAVHQAVQSIRAGESEMCIVAACHLHFQPDDWISMSMSGLLSDHSKTYSFDHRAQAGYARGEGAACLILKPLEQAIADNDAIRSVIVSSGINQDGRTIGLATPSTEAQERLIRSVYEKAGLDPMQVGFVEAHGTATKVGDPLEATAIYKALGRGRTDRDPLYFGSVKSNVGHLENVSGLVALIKSTLALEHNTIPPNINFERANERIPLQEWNMEVRQEKQAAMARRTTLSLLVKDHPDLFTSAFADNLAYTLCQRRSHMAWRLAVTASCKEELMAGLESLVEPTLRSSNTPRLVFIFTGQAADGCLKDLGADFSLIEELERSGDQSRIHLPQISQPACTAVQLALIALLSSWKIEPVAALGHSSGEIAAAYAAGALSFQDALAVSYYRGEAVGRFQERYPSVRGTMLAIGDSAAGVRQMIEFLDLDRSIVVACENSPKSTTASGDEVSIDKLVEELHKRNIFCRKLRVSIAYHSAHMKLVAPDYATALEKIEPTAHRSAVFYSSLLGGVTDSDFVLSASYWASNLTEPVLFSAALGAICTEMRPTAFVEVGPHSTLQGPIKQVLMSLEGRFAKAIYSPTLVRHEDATKSLVALAALLFTLGQGLDLEAVNGQRLVATAPKVVTSLAPYPWSGEKYWCESRLSQQRRLKPFGRHDLLGVLTEFSSDLDLIWRNIINTDNLPWLNTILHPAFLDQFFQLPFAILGAGSDGMNSLFMPVSVKQLNLSRNAADLAGRSVEAVAECSPRVGRLSPADFVVEGWDDSCPAQEPLLQMTAVRMLPVANSKQEEPVPRRLCYRLQWEPLDAGDDPTVDSDDANSIVDRALRHPPDAVNDGPPMRREPLVLCPVVIICDKNDADPLVSTLVALLSVKTGHKPHMCSLDRLEIADATCIAICDLEHHVSSSVGANMLTKVKELFLQPSSLLWVSTGLHKKTKNPSMNLIQGLARTVRSEYGKLVATLGLDPGSQQSPAVRARLIVEALATFLASEEDDNLKEFEFAEGDGELTNKLAGPYLQSYEQQDRRLQLDVGIDGAIDSLYFKDETPQAIRDDEIEIEVAATGVNFKDVVVVLRHVSSPCIGIECSGTVSRTGAAVKAFKKGDRVCCMSMGAYGTFARCNETSAARIPDGMTMEVAASIPVAFCTAYYGLVVLGKLQPGERVLIHAGAGGVGQAAIQLGLMLGAEIFATVGSDAKKQLLMSLYGIPEERIFSSRSSGFGSAIQDATKGQGVAVAINSLTGDLLRETWSCIADFGSLIEIGKRDITWNTRLDMDQFDRNVTFSSADLTLIGAKRPNTMRMLINKVMDLFARGKISPITPITVKGVSQVGEALRMLQGGKNMGKLVICPRKGEQVRATNPTKAQKILRKNATYIIAGGTGGIGRSIARWMASRGAGYIVLLSRSARQTPQVQDVVEQCKNIGTEVHVEACDVADEQRVKAVLRRCARDLAPIAGVIQAAMALRDMLFEEMSFADFEAVVGAKWSGTWNLHHALLDSKLDFFTMLSSLTGVVGNRGQAAYAAANTFLDAFAQYRNTLGMPAVSIALTPVLDVGYLADNPDRQTQVLRNVGNITLREEEVLGLVEASIDGRMAELCGSQCIIGLDFSSSPCMPYYASDARFSHIRAALDAADTRDDEARLGKTPGLADQVRQAASSLVVLDIVTRAVQHRLCVILMLRSEEVDAAHSVTSHGLDSLNAIELRNWIRKELFAPLQVLEVLSSGSLRNLAVMILRKTSISHCYRG
ncbi:hypothetical protein MY11210_008941 [Beauveria gryllotalpidicola]